MMRDSDIGFDDKKAMNCFGMSKMTVINEKEGSQKYYELRFVEFIEMIGRIAEVKYANTSMMEIPLHERIEYIMDDIFPKMLNKERNPVVIIDVEESASDEDY